MLYFLFPIALFISACLLFVIQPVVAKVLLPIYGGTPAVWTVCMFFFQALLLISYAYAWMLSRFKGQHTWKIIHLLVCLVSLSFLPVDHLFEISITNRPEWDILITLVKEMGLPLLVIGASAPLLQYAFSLTRYKTASDPYYLYVASNTGSLLALLSYPWIIEAFSTVRQQFYGWNIFYIVYFGMLTFLFFRIEFQKPLIKTETTLKVTWQQVGLWTILSFIPCSLMLGVTFYITTDIAATPLLWVIPLALYLLSFIITFAKKPIISRQWVEKNTLLVLIFPILGFIFGVTKLTTLFLILFHLAGFFILALLCHGVLIKNRPPASLLTAFYFCLALGGVLAGLFNSIIAPMVFSYPYEYPFIMLLGLLFIPVKKQKAEWLVPAIVFLLLLINYWMPGFVWGQWLKKYQVFPVVALILTVLWSSSRRTLFISMLILFLFIFTPWFKDKNILTQQRNFYGIKQVTANNGIHSLYSQSTIHGFQMPDSKRLDGTIGYYAPAYSALQSLQSENSTIRAMILGLGTGIMACQFRKQDDIAMVEIDKQVIDIAGNPSYFTYLRDCPANVTIIEADGRLAVRDAKEGSYDSIIVDVFNSDSIPTHLLTQEAFNLYYKKIKENGVILVHISNRHLNLLPVVTAAGRNKEMIVLHYIHSENLKRAQFASEWVLLTTNEPLAMKMMGKSGWRFVTEDNVFSWTDNYSNIIPILKF